MLPEQRDASRAPDGTNGSSHSRSRRARCWSQNVRSSRTAVARNGCSGWQKLVCMSGTTSRRQDSRPQQIPQQRRKKKKMWFQFWCPILVPKIGALFLPSYCCLSHIQKPVPLLSPFLGPILGAVRGRLLTAVGARRP